VAQLVVLESIGDYALIEIMQKRNCREADHTKTAPRIRGLAFCGLESPRAVAPATDSSLAFDYGPAFTLGGCCADD
jgi:hypothetical protein